MGPCGRIVTRGTPTELFDFLSDPAQFPNLAKVRSHEYEIGPGPVLHAGRQQPVQQGQPGWGTGATRDWDTSDRKAWEVPRSLLTGKAFYIYWPHGVPFGPEHPAGTATSRLPFRPYVERMKWIR